MQDYVIPIIYSEHCNCANNTKTSAKAEPETNATTETAANTNDFGVSEAHGTGTALGDPIEARSLREAVISQHSGRESFTLGAGGAASFDI